MFDLNRRKLLLGSLMTGAAVSSSAFAFAEDRYQVLMRLQQDVLDFLRQCQSAGRANYFDTGYEAKKAAYENFLNNRWANKLSQKEVVSLSNDIGRAEQYMRQTTLAEWRLRDGDAKAGVLLDYLVKEFNRSDLNDPYVRQMVHDLSRGKIVIDALDVNQLRQVEDAVVVLAVTKNLLGRSRAPVNTANIEAFEVIVTRYKDLIL